jgi:hypothetical protein
MDCTVALWSGRQQPRVPGHALGIVGYDGDMTAKAPSIPEGRRPRGMRQAGYAATIVIDAIFLFVANNILSWDVLPWLTEEFSDVLPIMNASLLASLVVNAVYLMFDPPVFRSVCELALLALTIAVGVTMLRVFPFDFAAYTFDWEIVTRWIIGITLVAMCIGFVASSVKLAVDVAGRVGQTHIHA